MITGIDVSAWQPHIDWSQVAAAGHRFAYLKATEGERYTSPVFAAQWDGAQRAGVYVGAYHFAQPDEDATDDADRFVEALGARLGFGALDPVLDLETTNGLDPLRLCLWARQWIERVEALTSRWPILYTGPSFWRWRMLPAGQPALDLTSWRLWQAQYGVAGPSPMQDALAWRPLIWQHTGSGACPGIDGHVDLNRWLGSEDDLRQAAGGTA